jgi:WD40 repeat protein
MTSGMTGAERAEVMVRMKFGPNHGIEFSPDGALLAVCSAHHVEVIDARSRRVLRWIRGHAGMVAATATTLTGLVWDAVTGGLAASFGGHSDLVTLVAFSPDGTLVVSVAVEETARVWEADTGRDTVVLAQHRGTDTDAAPATACGGRPGYAGSG